MFKLTLLIGLAVGFLAISTSHYPKLSVLMDTEQAAEQSENDEGAVLKAFDAIPSSAQFTLTHEFLLINILPDLSEEKDEESTCEDTAISGSKILKILFQRIISPNAP